MLRRIHVRNELVDSTNQARAVKSAQLEGIERRLSRHAVYPDGPPTPASSVGAPSIAPILLGAGPATHRWSAGSGPDLRFDFVTYVAVSTQGLWARVKTRTLLLYGDSHNFYLTFRDCEEAALNNSHTRYVANSGAFVMQDNPATTADALKFFLCEGGTI